MRCTYYTTKSAITVIALWLALSQNPANAFSIETIFNWVKTEMNITENYPLAEIHFLNKEDLQEVFRKNNDRSFKRWTGEYGKKKADEIMALYLDNVLGLCIKETQKIYVGNFIERCKRDSIVAHELVHYFQIMEEGILDPELLDSEYKLLYNEMQAGMIERTYMQNYCGAN